MRDITEYIDDYVYQELGHTNWGYTSTYSKEELADKSQYELQLDNSIVVWYEEEHNSEICDECIVARKNNDMDRQGYEEE